VHVSPRFTDLGFRILNTFHRTVVRASGGRLGTRAYGLDMVELVTTGRRSGRAHSTMLLAPLRDGSDLVLVASKGGDQRDPDWYKNLVVNPLVRVTMRGESVEMLARVATPEERALLWPRTVARYRHYEGYQRRAGRLIPLVICTPRGVVSETA
jgi:deazaflavin-dependent oxidoreductase (nitroreductase family)